MWKQLRELQEPELRRSLSAAPLPLAPRHPASPPNPAPPPGLAHHPVPTPGLTRYPASPKGPRPLPCLSPGQRPIPHGFGKSCAPRYPPPGSHPPRRYSQSPTKALPIPDPRQGGTPNPRRPSGTPDPRSSSKAAIRVRQGGTPDPDPRPAKAGIPPRRPIRIPRPAKAVLPIPDPRPAKAVLLIRVPPRRYSRSASRQGGTPDPRPAKAAVLPIRVPPRPLPPPCPYSGPHPLPCLSPGPRPLPCLSPDSAHLPDPPPGPARYCTVSASPVRHSNNALGHGGHSIPLPGLARHPASPKGPRPLPCLSPGPPPLPCLSPGPRPIPHGFASPLRSHPPRRTDPVGGTPIRPPRRYSPRSASAKAVPDPPRPAKAVLPIPDPRPAKAVLPIPDPRPAKAVLPIPERRRPIRVPQSGTPIPDPRPAKAVVSIRIPIASSPCPAPQYSPRLSTSRNEDPSARPPIPYRVLMGRNSESSSDAVRESENLEDSFVLCLSSDEGEGDEVTSASTSDIPVAPILPHNPRPGPKIEMRHSLVKGMSPHGRTDPGYNVCLYSRTHTQDLLDVVACKACGGDLTITLHGRGLAQYDSWHCHTCCDLTATKHQGQWMLYSKFVFGVYITGK
ncbi:hypothetical protein C7M84_009243 [Penaeus vannamei]|uniref:Uncharacterized protein n=1 Tax=Penaeus vannamei TaxID=6689 RepID=A0A423T7F2_PENVA|nr:hypothetical protein C7M84_009243 [Penaeus vannamei]